MRMKLKLLLAKLWNNPLLVGFLAVIAGLVYFAFWQKWNEIGLSLRMDDLLNKMSPLILTSAFVERAVEILISPWRDAGASKLDSAVTAIKARPNDAMTPVQNAQNALDLQAATEMLDSYRGQTQRYAFAAGLVLSFCASAVGVRALWPFVTDVTVFTTT